MRKSLILLSLLFCACTHHVRIDFPNTIPAPDRHKHWVNGWLFHLVGGETNTALYCGDRPVHRIDVKQSFGNSIVSWLTFGIYTPMHVTVQCAERQQPGVIYAPPPAYMPQQPPPAVYVPPPG